MRNLFSERILPGISEKGRMIIIKSKMHRIVMGVIAMALVVGDASAPCTWYSYVRKDRA